MAVHRFERGELWKSKARFLQLRLRDRFRIAVDRHHRRPSIFSDDYFSSTFVQRWVARFRDFRRDSLQSSSAFCRKRVSEDLNGEEESVIISTLRSVAVPLIGSMCHVFMNGLNSVQVYGVEKLHDALLRRPKNKALLTVSNHVASVDDPFIIASLLPPRVLLDAQNVRWTLCASDRCFKNPATSAFFKCVKVLPVSRGDGVYQKGMDMAIAKLNSGGWVHIFPEGSRSRDGGKTMGSAKRGVGRLVFDADAMPIVIPFVHTGMQEILPIGASFPRIGKTVTVLVGDPIHFDDLLNVEGIENISRGKLYDAVASRIGQRLHELKFQVERLAFEQPYKLQNTTESMNMAANNEDIALGRKLQQTSNVTFHHDPTSDQFLRWDSSCEGGIVSRICGHFEPTELLGFAARGLYKNFKPVENTSNVGMGGPLMVWKQLFGANLQQQ